MGRDNPAFPQRPMQQLKVWLLEQAFRRTLRVAAVGDDDVELVLLVRQELEPVAYVRRDIWVLEAQAHARQVFLREADDGLVDVAEDGMLDCRVLDDFAEDATVTAADDEDGFGVRVGVHGEMGYHFLVAILFSVSL